MRDLHAALAAFADWRGLGTEQLSPDAIASGAIAWILFVAAVLTSSIAAAVWTASPIAFAITALVAWRFAVLCDGVALGVRGYRLIRA